MSALRELLDKLFYGEHGEAMRYLFFGVLNVVITWISYSVLVLLGVDLNISNILSWVIGVSFAFVVNKLYVFESKSTDAKTVGKEAASFTLGRVITGLIAILGFPVLYAIGLNQTFMGVDGLIAKIVVTAIEVALNYLFSKYLVFQKSGN